MTATYRGGALPVPAYCSSRPRAVWRMVGSSWGENDRFFFVRIPLGSRCKVGVPAVALAGSQRDC